MQMQNADARTSVGSSCNGMLHQKKRRERRRETETGIGQDGYRLDGGDLKNEWSGQENGGE